LNARTWVGDSRNPSCIYDDVNRYEMHFDIASCHSRCCLARNCDWGGGQND